MVGFCEDGNETLTSVTLVISLSGWGSFIFEVFDLFRVSPVIKLTGYLARYLALSYVITYSEVDKCLIVNLGS